MSFTSDCRGDDILQESSSPDCKDVTILQDYVHAFISSKVIFTACELNMFDVLAKSEVPLSSKAVAECIGTSIRGTQCLLDGCVGLKLLETDFQNGEVYYKNTQLSQRYLTKNGSRSLFNAVVYFSKEIYPRFNLLKDSVWQGSSVNVMQSGVNFFKEIYRSEDRTVELMHYMDSSWNLHSKEDLISAFDLSSYKTICDLGDLCSDASIDLVECTEVEIWDSKGHPAPLLNSHSVVFQMMQCVIKALHHLLCNCCQRRKSKGCSGTLAKVCSSMFPTSSIIVYDLPEVIQRTQKHFKSQEENISFQQGDFFVDPLPNADLFIVARVMHDWDDDTCLKLLKRIYMAVEPDGGILIIDAILNEDRTGHALVHLQNTLMFMLTDGKERTTTELKTLLETAGFKDIQFSKKNILSCSILGRK